jgi:hypothetical protein
MRPVRTLNPGRLWRLDALSCLRTSLRGPARATTPLTGRQMTAMSSALVTWAGTVGHGCEQRRKAHSHRSGEASCNDRRVPPPATRSTASSHGGGPHGLNYRRSGLCPET